MKNGQISSLIFCEKMPCMLLKVRIKYIVTGDKNQNSCLDTFIRKLTKRPSENRNINFDMVPKEIIAK
jgi:hypothetical protein